MTEKNDKIWKQPWVVYIIITSIIGLTSFLIGHKYKIDANIRQIQEIKKCLDERPTNKELSPILKNIEDDIKELKEKINKIYDFVIKENND